MAPLLESHRVIYRDPYEGQTDVWKKMREGQTLDEGEMKQLFHTTRLHEYGNSSPDAPQEGQMLREYAIQQLAQNMVENAERTEDGDIILLGVPVRPEDAQFFAEASIRHFDQTDTHLRPDQLVAAKGEAEQKKSKSTSERFGPQTFQSGDVQANTAYGFMSNVQYPEVKPKPPSWIINQKSLPKGIELPKGVDVNANIAEAQRHYLNVLFFKDKVDYRGDWDYKVLGKQYESFGNFHYGLIGAAMGFEKDFLLRAAGFAGIEHQVVNPKWGDPGLVIIGGTLPYGDDPKDQFWIQVGIEYYRIHRDSLP